MSKKLQLVVMVSGSGTNLQAMIDRIEENRLQARIVLVISDNPEAYGIERAKKYGIPTEIIDYSRFGKKSLPEIPWDKLPVDMDSLMARQRLYPVTLSPVPSRNSEAEPVFREKLARMVLAENELISLIDRFSPDYICLAGYMRLLSPFFLDHYHRGENWKVINIHPALLPAFPGTNGYGDTFDYGCRFGGVTVHFVDEGEDSGPIIAQAVYPIWPYDDLETIRARGLKLEYELYSQCLIWLANDNIKPLKKKGPRTIFQITDPGYRQFMERLNQMAWETSMAGANAP